MNPKHYGWGLPVDISTHGAEIDRLIHVLHIFMFLLFAGWLIFLVIALVRYRKRPGHKASYKAHHFKTPTYVEVGVALFELVLLFAFSIPLFYRIKNIPFPKEEALQVRVVAEQFAWNIHYPGADGIFGRTDPALMKPSNPIGLDREDPNAADDITTINQLHVPVNKPVSVQLASKDVIHSFAIPVLRVKQDVIPGTPSRVWFQAKQTGNFEIACAQLCGLGHYRMRGFVMIKTEEEFSNWLAKMSPVKPPAPPPAPTQGAT